MMKALIVLTLFGCDDAVSRCDVLLQPEATYVSAESCQQSADTLLDASLDQPYPTLVVQCATADDTMEFIHEVAPPEQIAAVARRLGHALEIN